MKRFAAQSGPFAEQLRFSIQEIDSMCIEALKNAGLLPSSPEPIRIERFVEKHFKCSVRHEDMGEGVMGCTVFRENGSVELVVISTLLEDGRESSERRVHSTLAHEAGHCLMHASLFIKGPEQHRLGLIADKHENLDFKERRILCRENDVAPVGSRRGYNGRWWEWQANRAIGSFLLPVKLVQQALAPFLEVAPVTKSPSLRPTARKQAERDLAGIFEVNPVVARIRLQELFPENSAQMEF